MRTPSSPDADEATVGSLAAYRRSIDETWRRLALKLQAADDTTLAFFGLAALMSLTLCGFLVFAPRSDVQGGERVYAARPVEDEGALRPVAPMAADGRAEGARGEVSGGGGGGGGGGYAARAGFGRSSEGCDVDIQDALGRTAGFRLLSYWRSDDARRCSVVEHADPVEE